MTGDQDSRSAPECPPSLGDQAWLTARPTQVVLKLLEDAGYEARVVGGAVRNALLGTPVRDLDVATTATPDQVIAAAEAAALHVVPTGLKHGTVTIVVDREPIEVTTLREDVATDGRHAQVRFTTVWQADAARRDFTINALYCAADGTIHDPLGGYRDIVSRSVRFIGDPNARIGEDYLRILRFFRFSAEYGTAAIDRVGLKACIQMRHGLRRLSGERIRQEVVKLLVAPRMPEAMQAMRDYGLLGEVLPAVPRLGHLARLAGHEPRGSAMLRLACLALSAREDVERISKTLRLSNADKAILENLSAVIAVRDAPSLKMAKRWLYGIGREAYSDRMLYLTTQSFRSLGDPRWRALEDLPRTWRRPTFPLAGRDAIAAGATPGPAIGRLLRALEAEWIESDYALTREELLEKLSRILKDAN